jgi:hypothetical protein
VPGASIPPSSPINSPKPTTHVAPLPSPDRAGAVRTARSAETRRCDRRPRVNVPERLRRGRTDHAGGENPDDEQRAREHSLPRGRQPARCTRYQPCPQPRCSGAGRHRADHALHAHPRGCYARAPRSTKRTATGGGPTNPTGEPADVRAGWGRTFPLLRRTRVLAGLPTLWTSDVRCPRRRWTYQHRGP